LDHDVIIAGAGPAGAVLAYHLASHGLGVRLIEKARLPRYKTCGGGLTYKSLRSLPFDVSTTIETVATGGILAYGGRTVLKLDIQPPVASLVMREQFDQFLVEKALGAGAQLSDGLAVRGVDIDERGVSVRTAKASFRGRALAGADGVHSLVARSAGLLPGRAVGVAIEAELAVPEAALVAQGPYATFDFGALPYGYGWIFPKSDHLSVGVFHARPGKAPGLKDQLEAYIGMNRALDEHEPLQVHGHHIPLGGGRDKLQDGRVLLVGDAANLADAWLGEGLYYAIQSGTIAAQVIREAFEDGTLDLSAYSTRVHSQIVRGFNHARAIAWLTYHLPRLGTSLARRSAYLRDHIFGVMRGDITFPEMTRALLLGVPRILAQVARSK
jgi:geranylgeranyl reductase family protein